MSLFKKISLAITLFLVLAVTSLPVLAASDWVFDSTNKLLYSDGTDTTYIFGGNQVNPNGFSGLIHAYTEGAMATFNLGTNSNGRILWQRADNGNRLFEHTILGANKDVYSFAGSDDNTFGFNNVFMQAYRNTGELRLTNKTRITGGLGSSLKEVVQTTAEYQATTKDYTLIPFDNTVGSVTTRTIYLPKISEFPNQIIQFRRKGAGTNTIIVKPHPTDSALIGTIAGTNATEVTLPAGIEMVTFHNNQASFWYQY